MNDGSIRIGTKLDTSGLKAEIKALEAELKAVQKEADKLNAKEQKVSETFAAEREIDSMVDEKYSHKDYIDEREAEALSTIRAEREVLNQKTQEYTAMLDQANAKLQQQSDIARASKELDSAVKANSVLDKITTQEQYNSLLDQTRAKMAEIEALASGVATSTGVNRDALLAANPQYQKLADTLYVLENTTKSFGDESAAAGDKAKRGFSKAKKEANGLGSSITKGIKQLGKMALAIFSIRSAYSAVRMAVREYLSTNEELAGQIEALKAGFGQVLGPAIEWVINLVMQAVSAVNSFVFALSGINYIARANETALKKQAKAAGAAKAQLAGFDEMNRLNDSAGGGGSSPTMLDASVDITPFIEKLKEQILAGDWYGAGATVGEALMDGMYNIDWSNLGSTIGEILSGAVALALGVALNLDPLVLLSSVAEFFAGFFDGVSETIQGLDWGQLGSDIVDLFLKGIIATMIITNPFATIIAILFTPEGKELASSASELVGSIIGALLSAIVGAAMRIGEIGIEIWNTIKTYFDDYIDWESTPEDIIAGLWEGIIDALKNAGRWIYENIWIPFRDGFKEAFDIHSPSGKMKEFGGNIIDGLWQGIINGLSKIKNACVTIWETIKGVFSTVGEWFKNTFSDAWTKVKDVFSTGGKIFDGIKEGIESTFKTIVNGLIGGINKVISVPFNKINSVLNTIRSIKVLDFTPFAGMWSYNPLSVPQIPKLAVGGIVNRPGRGVPAIIGEAGAEAVLPLENNTEWMDILADKIGGNVTIPIYMDGKKIATYVVDIQKKKAFAMNGA